MLERCVAFADQEPYDPGIQLHRQKIWTQLQRAFDSAYRLVVPKAQHPKAHYAISEAPDRPTGKTENHRIVVSIVGAVSRPS
jgi:hypothetical protein